MIYEDLKYKRKNYLHYCFIFTSQLHLLNGKDASENEGGVLPTGQRAVCT